MVQSTFEPRSGEWATVAGALHVHTVAELALLAEVVGVPSLGRKDDRIAALCRVLEGERLRFTFGRLTSLQQAAVSMATHSLNGKLSLEGFRLRHGGEPDFGKKATGWSGLDEPSLLCLFIHGDRIPRDLLFRLRGWVPPPAAVAVPTIETPPEQIEIRVPHRTFGNRSDEDTRRRLPVRTVERSGDALSELVEVLRLVEGHALTLMPKKRQPSKAALDKLTRALAGGADFLDAPSAAPETFPREVETDTGVDELGAIRAFAWPQLLLVGGLVRARGKTLVLSQEGGESLIDPAPDVLRQLWERWLRAPDADELHRISGVRGRMSKDTELTDPAKRRRAIAAALSDCPVGCWVSVDALFDYIRMTGRDFEVTRTPETLSVERHGFGHGYGLSVWSASERWIVLQGRVVLCFLFETAATLGLVDVAYSSPLYARTAHHDAISLSRYDGLQAFRVTELGAYCLGLSKREPELPLATRGRVVLGESLEIETTGRLYAADQSLLEKLAAPASDGIWNFSRPRVLHALERGETLASLREGLVRRHGASLPKAVEAFLKDCHHRSKSLKRAGSARLLRCRDAATAEAVASDPRTSPYCHRAGATLIAVPLESEASFYRALRAVGFGAS